MRGFRTALEPPATPTAAHLRPGVRPPPSPPTNEGPTGVPPLAKDSIWLAAVVPGSHSCIMGSEADECPFVEKSVPEWADVVQQTRGDGIAETGTCSSCGHRTTNVTEMVVTSGAGFHADSGDDGTMQLVYCDCGNMHAGRQEGQYGCGGYWMYPQPRLAR